MTRTRDRHAAKATDGLDLHHRLDGGSGADDNRVHDEPLLVFLTDQACVRATRTRCHSLSQLVTACHSLSQLCHGLS
jgi:hypothetical protein